MPWVRFDSIRWFPDKNWEWLAGPLLLAFAVSLFCLLIRGLFLKAAARVLKSNPNALHESVFHVFRTPSFAWCLAIGLYVGIAFSDLPGRYIQQLFKGIYVILIISITLTLANMSAVVLRHSGLGQENGSRSSGIATALVKGIVIALGLLLTFSMLGISITPILTALGVGGLAVALALKDTLENLFAGLYLITDRAIRVGDFVKLETGHEGRIEDISWRSTRISLLNNNILILPNSKLAQSVLTNYSLPEDKISISVKVAVHQDEDPEKVESALNEVGKYATTNIVGVASDPAPVARFSPGFTDSALEFTLSVHVGQFSDQFAVQHELRKMIYKQLKTQGIRLAQKSPGGPTVPAA